MKKIKKLLAMVIVFSMVATSCFVGTFLAQADTTPISFENETALFTGDSIGAGWRDNAGVADYSNSGGWSKRIADDYGMQVTLAASAGAPISTIRKSEGRNPIVDQLHANKNKSFDYVVLQGGFNDAMGTNAARTKESAAPVGVMTDSFNVSDFDTSTFAGALENLFYYANEYFSDSKIGFIITYATPLSTYGGYTAEEDSMRAYWNMAKSICDKWNIKYLDLFDGTATDGKSYSYDILKVDTTENFPGGGDCIHLNASGYDAITPYIAEWLTTIGIWNGTHSAPKRGTGTEEDPYLISTPEELSYLNAVYVGTYTYYKLTADIYLNDITKINWQDGTIEEGYTVNQWYKNTTPNWFNGVLDGDGHTVYGMYVTDETNDIHLGLLQGTRQNGQITIKNLGIDCAYVNAPNGDAAAFAGLTQSGTTTFDTCYVGANVTLTGANAGSFCGRAGTSLAISKSYSLAAVTGTTRYGSAVGDCWGSTRTIDNSFFTNAPITSHTGHGFTCTNVYATNIVGAQSGATQLTTDNMQGFDALSKASKMPGLAECGAFTATKSYPVPNIFYKGAEGGEEVELEIWDGTEIAPIYGTGTEEDPYLISRPGELAYLNAVYVGTHTYYKLTADIYLNDITKINWQDGTIEEGYTVNQWYKNTTPNWFNGVLDGDGHTVYGMYVTDETNDIHLGLLQGTRQNSQITIKNLGIDCAYVNAPNGDAAAFAGLTQSGTTTFDTCYAGANVKLTGANAGSFCGRAGTSLVISKSYSLATVTGTTRYGAAVGDCWGSTRTIDNSFFVNGPVTSHTGHGFICTNVYTTNIVGAQSGATQLTTANMQGFDALSKASKMSGLAECNAFTATSSYPVLTNFSYLIPDDANNGDIEVDLLDFEETYLDSSDNLYYGNTAENWSANNSRGSKAELGVADGNHFVRLTYDNENSNENYNANAVLNIYDPKSKSKFVGEEGVRYTISFDYKVERTDGQSLQLFIAPSNRENSGSNYPAFKGTDMGPLAVIPNNYTTFTAASGVITEVTEDWVHTSVAYTASAPVNEHTVYPIILLQTNGKAKDASTTENYASVLIDNIKVGRSKRALITCYDYDGSDNTLFIYEDTRFADLDIPFRKGYTFEGWYIDSEYTQKASNDEFAGNYGAIYAKWSGNGEVVTPHNITDSFTVDIKKVNVNSINLDGSTPHQISYVQNSMIDVAGSASVSDFYGSYVFSSDSTVVNSDETIRVDGINVTSPASNTVMFYVELPDFEKAGAGWGLAFGNRGICIRQNSWIWTDITSGTNNFDYCLNNEWVSSTITSAGVFTGLPSGYKGYIRIDLSALTYQSEVDFTSAYIFNCLELKFNALGGDNGNAVLGGLLYFPSTISDSTVVQIDGFYYELSKSSDAIVVNTYDVKSETGSSFSTRYTGTVGVAAVRYADDSETSAFWSDSPAVITTSSGNAETTTGYMTTYINNKAAILMQPGVDTMMFYVEMPVFNQSNTSAGLKFLDSTVEQGNKTKTLSFSNSIYWYADVNDASWKIARAGADGDLFDIPSGFKGFIKFDIKQFKNISDFKTVIDFSNMYYVTKFEFGFNHIGGENGNLVIGGAYSVINDSNAPFIKNGITLDKRCFKIITGDFDCDGTYDADDMILIKDTMLDKERELNGFEKLRENNIDIRTLVRAKKVFTGNAETDISVDYDNGAVYREVFTQDTSNNNAAIVYSPQAVTDWSRKIEADTSLNSEQKAIDFANEINSNTVGDFEKIGIDKMCHVSTFLYANGNIYVTYYANTISATENPKYQVARFAYAPENNTDAKVVLDIMQVGDDLYGHKVTGVYDTILMQKNDEPNNIYILWTASINGKYYRLYRIFNLTTQELGEIGVNRFKVGNVTNDFSSSGMMKALEVNSIGYKTFFSDIGIMQKLSTRVENGVTYYYTGAYSGNFTCIIKSKDLITWEYVAQPNEGANGTGFANATKWENAVYVLGDKVYYFVRQCDAADSDVYGSNYGILTCYNLNTNEWATPVLVGDCQSRSDFIYYQGNLYVFYAPTDRNHIGILKIDTDDIAQTEVVLQADMNGSCFYPFVQYNSQGELCMSYTVNRQHIRLASFTLSNYIN